MILEHDASATNSTVDAINSYLGLMDYYEKGNLTDQEINLLLTSGDYFFLKALAINPNTTEKTLIRLLEKKHYIAHWATEHPNATELTKRLYLMKHGKK